ncbi:MAG: glycosyltransferase [Pirellulaceae bacterium]
MLSLLPDIRHHLQIAHQSAEVIVVDDASSDGTPEVVKSFAADSSDQWRVRLIQRVGETGLSSAAVAGMQAATGNILMLMDADHSHPAA